MTTKHFFLIAAVFSFSISLAQGKFVTYEVDNEPYEGYYIRPSTGNPGNAALVLILHDWDGLTDYEVKRANMLAEEGYQVFAADLFGKGIRPTENKEKAQHTGELYKDRSKLRRLMTGALHAARQ
jgi:dienelactone hydrolase